MWAEQQICFMYERYARRNGMRKRALGSSNSHLIFPIKEPCANKHDSFSYAFFFPPLTDVIALVIPNLIGNFWKNAFYFLNHTSNIRAIYKIFSMSEFESFLFQSYASYTWNNFTFSLFKSWFIWMVVVWIIQILLVSLFQPIYSKPSVFKSLFKL